MIKKITLAVICCVVLGGVALTIFHKPEAAVKANGGEDMLPVELKTIQVKGGWGYEIYVDHKKYISQPFIPDIDGYKPFVTEKDAKLVGNLAVKRITQGIIPGIVRKDLEALHITIPADQ
jgi:hypothetical protein